MLIVSPSTGTALASYATEQAYVMFVQASPIAGAAGPIWIEGIKGSKLGTRLGEIARLNAYDTFLIGLYETTRQEQEAYAIRTRYDDDRLRDYWFEATTELLAFVQANAQA